MPCRLFDVSVNYGIYIYIYTIAISHIKVTNRCYICDIHPTTGGYETTYETYNDIHNRLRHSEHVQSSKRVGDELFTNGKGA